jgi:NADH-quinone oxidoreductase subunit N
METNLKLEITLQSLGFISPEIALSVGILVLLITGLISKKQSLAKVLALLICSLNLILLISNWPLNQSVNLFNGMLTLDVLNFLLRVTIASTALIIVFITQVETVHKYPSEYFALVLSIVLGGQMLVMSNHMAMVIISLELMSIPAYVLTGFAFTKESAEASMKYFIYGSVATAFLIFGMSWLYGLGKGLELSAPTFIDQLGYNNNPILLAACLFVLAGLLFKMAATPFHFWAPDVYQATPYTVLALFSTIPKIAAGALLMKTIHWFSLNGQSRYDWQTIACALSILTLAVGNFSALWQKNVKRLMAYSSIGQAGFLLAATTIQTELGSQFFLFYAVVLAISTVLVFVMLEFYQSQFNAKTLADFAGLGKRNSLPAILLTVGLLSLTGLPITAGFTAKLLVFSGILEVWQGSDKPALLVLFVFGLINTVVSLYYYFRIPYYMFLKDNEKGNSVPLKWAELLIGIMLALGLVIIFVWPALIMGV